MRSYPVDSNESMARVIVLAMLADGGIDPVEHQLLERPDIVARMGLDHDCLNNVTREFCEDLDAYGIYARPGQVGLDPATIDHLLGEIRSPALRANLLRAMLGVVHANGHLTGGEGVVIGQAMSRWGLELCEEPPQPQERRKYSPRPVAESCLGEPLRAAAMAARAAIGIKDPPREVAGANPALSTPCPH
jgi:hypothetical protein